MLELENLINAVHLSSELQSSNHNHRNNVAQIKKIGERKQYEQQWMELTKRSVNFILTYDDIFADDLLQ